MGDKAVTFVNGRMKKAGDTGTVDFDGNVNLGNADTDNIVFAGEVQSDIVPDATATYNLGASSKAWRDAYVGTVSVSNQLIVNSTESELIRLQKSDTETRYFVFESDGVDKFEMYLNNFENFVFTTTDTTDDIVFRLNGHNAIYMDGFPKEVRIWDTYNSAYNTQINSSVDINGTAKTEAIVPKTDATYDLGDPATNVWNNVFAEGGNFKVVSMMVSAGDPSVVEDFGQIYTKDVSGSTEVFVQDDKGNVTQISPHNEDGEWHYFSRNVKTGKVVRINMEKMIRRLEEITGESFMEEWYE